jgi:hypothetical protein
MKFLSQVQGPLPARGVVDAVHNLSDKEAGNGKQQEGVSWWPVQEQLMIDTLEPLVGDLIAWVGNGRPYCEVMDAWKTSCPRLPVWEEARSRGLLNCTRDATGTEWVHLTPSGDALLRQQRAATR